MQIKSYTHGCSWLTPNGARRRIIHERRALFDQALKCQAKFAESPSG
jgi:hypothetical protein